MRVYLGVEEGLIELVGDLGGVWKLELDSTVFY